MIYTDLPNPDEPIRQGDIFRALPRIFFKPDEIPKVQSDNTETFGTSDRIRVARSKWIEELEDEVIQVVVAVERVFGIVASQDCDTRHRDFISFFLIDKCTDVLGQTPSPDS